MTENEVLKDLQNYQGILKAKTRINAGVNPEIALNAVTEAIDIIEKYRAIGTIEEFKALKEKSNKDFELLLKAVKESYPMFKGAYVELDVFMGDVMRRFTRDRKQS